MKGLTTTTSSVLAIGLLTAYLITSFHGGQQPPTVEGLIFPSAIPAMPVSAAEYTP